MPHQQEVFDCPAPRVVYVKGRRAGGTHGAVIRLLEIAHQRPGSRHLWVDTVHRNIAKIVRRYFIPTLAGRRFRWSATLGVLTFGNGASCDFGSAQRPENLEGFAYDTIWVNEASIVLKDEALYYQTLLPMALEASDARMFFIGTPKGPGLFQRMYEWGQDALDPDWRSFRHSSFVNPLLDPRALEALEGGMPGRVYRQEILAEFLPGEGAVFRDVERIATAEPETVPDPTAPYVLGVDLARYTDFTVAWVGRADTRTAMWCDRFRRLPWNLQVARLAELSRRYGNAPLYVDATGAGDPVCEDLERNGLAVAGIVLTGARKQQLIDRLAIAIEQARLRIVPDAQTLRELNAYEYRMLGSGQLRSAGGGGAHDDCVIALALCCWGMDTRDTEFILGSRLLTSETD